MSTILSIVARRALMLWLAIRMFALVVLFGDIETLSTPRASVWVVLVLAVSATVDETVRLREGTFLVNVGLPRWFFVAAVVLFGVALDALLLTILNSLS